MCESERHNFLRGPAVFKRLLFLELKMHRINVKIFEKITSSELFSQNKRLLTLLSL